MNLVSVSSSCYWGILTSLCKRSSDSMDMYMYHSNYCTLNLQLSTCPTQPPQDFQPPILGYSLYDDPIYANGWYHGQLREKQGVFSSQYVQFQYSRKLTEFTDQFLCASDTVLLLSVNHAVLCNAVVLFECD